MSSYKIKRQTMIISFFKFHFRDGLSSPNRNPRLKMRLQNENQFICRCILCLSGTSEIDRTVLLQDPLYKEGTAPLIKTIKDFRLLPRAETENYEIKAIEFLEKHIQFDPINATLNIQKSLETMWTVLSSRI